MKLVISQLKTNDYFKSIILYALLILKMNSIANYYTHRAVLKQQITLQCINEIKKVI